MGIPTLFNVLGPLLSPYDPARQLIGTAFQQYMDLIFEAGIALGKSHLVVVRGTDGLDEVTLTGPTVVREFCEGRRFEYEIQPADFGLTPVSAAELAVPTKADNLRIAQALLRGEAVSPHAQLVLVNAAFAYSRFAVPGTTLNLRDCYHQLRYALVSGAMGQQLETYQHLRSLAPAIPA